MPSDVRYTLSSLIPFLPLCPSTKCALKGATLTSASSSFSSPSSQSSHRIRAQEFPGCNGRKRPLWIRSRLRKNGEGVWRSSTCNGRSCNTTCTQQRSWQESAILIWQRCCSCSCQSISFFSGSFSFSFGKRQSFFLINGRTWTWPRKDKSCFVYYYV